MPESYVTSAHLLDRQQDRGQRSCHQARGEVAGDRGNGLVWRFCELVSGPGDYSQVGLVASRLEHQSKELGLVRMAPCVDGPVDEADRPMQHGGQRDGRGMKALLP